MIALDTNVLVRFLVDDDKAQSARATKLVRRAIDANEPIVVSQVVLCELVWVLRFSYKVGRADLVDTLRDLLHAQHLTFPDSDLLTRALDAFEYGQADFADYVIREHALGAGCQAVATFDRALLRDDGFIAP